jgi:small subunit ribosomal protein S14
MAKTSSIEKNNKRKAMSKRYSAKRAALKAVSKDQNASPEVRFEAQLKLAALPRNSSPGRVRNRCDVTGRPRGYYRKLRMSRIALRDLGNFGQIPGMVKSSW